MTNLPATWEGAVEREALAFARDWIARCQEGDFGDGYAPLHPEAGRAFVRRLLKIGAQMSPFNMDNLVELAKAGWDDADVALRDLIAEINNRYEPLPAILAAYNIWLINPRAPQPRTPKGRKKATNILADIGVATLIMTLIERFPLNPTRSHIGRKRNASACSIAWLTLTEAGLHRGGEEAVQQVWKRYAPTIMPGSRAEAILLARRAG